MSVDVRYRPSATAVVGGCSNVNVGLTAGVRTPDAAGTVQFDGRAYLDDAASDPNVLGWMQGNPVPPDRLVRFTDDNFLEFPRNRWALSHMRELLPTAGRVARHRPGQRARRAVGRG